MSASQAALDHALAAPQWVGFALLGLAALMTVLGRHGQRPLNAALLGALSFLLAFHGLRHLGAPHWLPGAVAIVAAVLAALFGFLTSGWGTAFLVGAVLACVGGALAHSFQLHPFLGAAPLFGIGLWVGMTNYVRLALILPPLFSACFAALGAAVAWGHRHALFPRLHDVRWTLALAAALALPLLAVSLARDPRRVREARS